MIISDYDARKKIPPPAPIRRIGGSRGGGSGIEINTPEHQRFVQATSGWFTPEAVEKIYNTPIIAKSLDRGSAAWNGKEIEVPESYFDSRYFDPEIAVDNLRHEYGHVFSNGQSGTTEFNDSALKTNARYFPGMGRTPRIPFFPPVPGEGWGGPDEAYASMAVAPYNFPSMRQYYPQYTDDAFYGEPAMSDMQNALRNSRFVPPIERGKSR